MNKTCLPHNTEHRQQSRNRSTHKSNYKIWPETKNHFHNAETCWNTARALRAQTSRHEKKLKFAKNRQFQTVLKYLAHSFSWYPTFTMMSRSSARDSCVVIRPLMTITYCRKSKRHCAVCMNRPVCPSHQHCSSVDPMAMEWAFLR